MEDIVEDLGPPAGAAPGSKPDAMPENGPALISAAALNRTDLFTTFLIFALAIFYTVPGIFIREYYRHTEADRTLIGWEMLERGDFLFPHLLGDYYLTKPPVFYGLLAASFNLFGGPYEWAARVVTVAAVCLLLTALYFFYRLSGLSRPLSLLSVAIFGVCGEVYHYSVVAEIDLTYVLFSTAAVAAVFLSVIRPEKLIYIALSGVFLVLAFFTKGPPVLVFSLSAIGSLMLFDRIRIYKQRSVRAAGSGTDQLKTGQLKIGRLISGRWLAGHGIVWLILAGLIAIWLLRLSSAIGWNEVKAIFNTEVLVRFIRDTKADERGRGPLFYFGSLLRGFIPWTILLAGLYGAGRKTVAGLFNRHRIFVIFCLGVILPSFLIFSLASGKSNRYLLPIYPFIAPLLAFCGAGLPQVLNRTVCRKLLAAAALAAVLTAAGIAVYFSDLPTGSRALSVVVAAVVCGGAAAYLWKNEAASWGQLAAVLAVCCIASRYPFSVFFDGTRNGLYSVRPVAAAFEAQLVPGQPVYIVELFERWLPYYIERDGFQVRRLTPEIAGNLSGTEGEIFVIINSGYEGWRKEQIVKSGGTFVEVSRLRTEKDEFALLRIPAKDAVLFRPTPIFATTPSHPY